MSVIVKGGGTKPEEEKTVTAGISVIEVNPSSGKVMKKVTVNPTPTESKSVTPTTSELTVTPSEGKHLSQVVVGAVEDVTPEVTAQTPVITQILEGLVGKAHGANATADKILEGYSAYVGQELLEGNYVPMTGIDYGEVTLTESSTSSFTIPTKLGKQPYAFLLYGVNVPQSKTNLQFNIAESRCGTYATQRMIGYNGSYSGGSESIETLVSYSNGTLTVKSINSYPFGAATYKWVALA